MTGQDWEIKNRSNACQKCGQPFADKQVYHSELRPDNLGYQRADYCTTCWAAENKQDAFSKWRGVYQTPPPAPEEPIKKNTAESLLRSLMATNEQTHNNTIYILALMLERKRILVEKDVQLREDGIKLRIYEHKATGETFLIPDPQLSLTALAHVQKEVLANLK